jgi:hypothetical protein
LSIVATAREAHERVITICRDPKGGHKMSSLLPRLQRLFAGLFSTPRLPLDPENMSLRDWADLPVHHPSRDRAPC